MRVDSLLVPTEVVAHEIYAQLSTPLLWRFLREMPGLGDAWAEQVIARLRTHCGQRLQRLWKTTLNGQEAPALTRWLEAGGATLGDLLRHPEDRDRRLDVVPLLILRGTEATLGPGDDCVLAAGDQVLFAGQSWARRALLDTMTVDSVSEYVLFGRYVPSSWIWQRLTRRPARPRVPTARTYR
jgi:hypothetical protein